MNFLRLNTVGAVARYFRICRFYTGRRIYILIALNFISATFESIGLLLFIPLLSTLSMGGQPHDAVSSAIYSIFGFLHIPVSLGSTLVFLVAAFCLKGASLFLLMAYRARLINSISKRLREQFVEQYVEQDFVHATGQRLGSLSQFILGDVFWGVYSIDNFSRCLTSVTTVGTLICAAIILQPQLFVLLVIAGLINLLILRSVTKLARKLARAESENGRVFGNELQTISRGYKYLKSTDRFAVLLSNIRKVNLRFSGLQDKLGIANAFSYASREPLQAIFIAGIIYYHVAVRMENAAPILVSLLLLQRCLAEMGSLQAVTQATGETAERLERLHTELLLTTSQIEDWNGTEPVDGPGSIRLENVHYAYGEKPVIEGVSLSIPANSSVAFVGPSGHGKTTLIDLLTGVLKPQSGTMYIDEKPFSSFDIKQYRSRIGYVSQDAVIFPESIANNIAMTLYSSPTQEQMQAVEEAARLAHVMEFIGQMPHGFQTIIGDGGLLLSAGQRQRIAIARELFRKPKLLILDESTASLDSLAEDFIQKTISELHGKVTVVLVSHRISTVRDVDQIFVIERGKLVEQGSLAELAQKSTGIFKKIYELQHSVPLAEAVAEASEIRRNSI